MSKVSTRPQKSATAAPVKDSSEDPNSVFYVAPGAKARPKSHAPDFPPPSPTTIVLFLVARDGVFENFMEHASEAGFSGGTLEGRVLSTGMASDDTGELFVTSHYRQWDALDKRLRQVEFRIDPEVCEIELQGGSRYRYALDKLAKTLGADIHDGLGNVIDDAGMMAIAKHINETLRRRHTAELRAREVVLPDGSVRVPGMVSFQHSIDRAIPGKPMTREREFKNFDVPALGGYAALGKAYRMIEELQQHLRKHRRYRVDFGAMIAASLGVEAPLIDFSLKPVDSNVAAAFLRILNVVIINGLTLTRPDWVTQQAAEYEQYARAMELEDKERKKTFVQRMRASKAAKKAQGKGHAS